MHMQRHWPWYLVIALAVLLVFAQAALFDFLQWDDLALIVNNGYVNPPILSHALMAWARAHAGLYIPLTYNVWAAIATVASTQSADIAGITVNPYPFHTANVLIHLLSAWLVYRIVALWWEQKWISATAAVIWAVHPIQVEAVAWATGMKDVLSGFLALAAIYLYLSTAARKDTEPERTRIRTASRYGAAAFCMMLATFAKPGVVGVPLFAIVLDLLVINRSWKTVLKCSWPLLLAVVPAVLATRSAQSVSGAPFISAVWTRPLLAGHALAFYLQKIIWPNVFGTDYGLTPVYVMAHWWGYAASLIPAAVTAAIILHKPGRRMLGAAGLVFLAGVAPVLGFAPFVFQRYSTVADRYVYLSMLGVALAVAYLLRRMPTRWAVTVACFICAILMIRAGIQTATWEDNRTLAEHTFAVNPNSMAGYLNAGISLMHESELSEYQASVETDPGRREKLLRLRDDQANQGVDLFKKALACDPECVTALSNLAIYYGGRSDYNTALKYVERATELVESKPWNAQNNTSDRLMLAKVCMNLKKYSQAEKHLQKWLQTHPEDSDAKSLLQQAIAGASH